MKKTLGPDEQILKTWNGCTLTNKKVWHRNEEPGLSEYRSFPLSQFQGAFVGKTSYPWLLYIGGFLCLASVPTLFTNDPGRWGAFLVGCFFGGLFLMVWHLTKSAQVLLHSGDLKISVTLPANKEDYAAAVDFVSEVETAASSVPSTARTAA